MFAVYCVAMEMMLFYKFIIQLEKYWQLNINRGSNILTIVNEWTVTIIYCCFVGSAQKGYYAWKTENSDMRSSSNLFTIKTYFFFVFGAQRQSDVKIHQTVILTFQKQRFCYHFLTSYFAELKDIILTILLSSMWDLLVNLSSRPRMRHYAVYIVTYLTYGILLVSLGPLIPFLAAQRQLRETEYSFLFTCRAVGMLLGSLVMNYCQSREKRPSIHQFLALACALIVLTNLLFMWAETPFSQGLWVFVGSVAYFLLEISINLSIIVISKQDDLQFWLMFINGVFSIGGILSPIIVRFLKINSYFVVSGIIGAMAPLYLWLDTPETFKKQISAEEKSQNKPTSVKVERLLCLIMFIYLGTIVSQSMWSPSYAVITGVYDKQNATINLTIFYLVSTVSRFGIALIKIKSSQKFKYSITGIIVFEILTVALLWSGFPKPALFFNSLVMGVTLSSIYALVFSVSSQFHEPLTEKQASSIAIWGVVGEGALSPICAKLMQFIHPDMYFFFVMAMGLVMELARRHLMAEFQKREQEQSGIEQQMFEYAKSKHDS